MRRVIATVIAGVALATAGSAQAASDHLCHQGDPPILASARTSCGLAVNYLDVWFNSRWWLGRSSTLDVRSPVTHRWYLIHARERHGYVTATGPNGIRFSFVGMP